MKSVHHHASVVIIESEEKPEFLFSLYDNTYPKVLYRGRVNLIGGNNNIEDNSPYDLLVRELKEEFRASQEEEADDSLIEILGKSHEKQKAKKFASQKDISFIKEGIIRTLKPFQDFHVKISSLEGFPSFTAIYSVFLSKLSTAVFACAKENIKKGNNITCEGNA